MGANFEENVVIALRDKRLFFLWTSTPTKQIIRITSCAMSQVPVRHANCCDRRQVPSTSTVLFICTSTYARVHKETELRLQ